MALLPPAFNLRDARDSGLRKDEVYAMLAAGDVERIGRGIYLRSGEIDATFSSLAGAQVACEEATMCLTSALVFHGLSDMIPFGTDIALPRGTRQPAGFEHVSWHSFDRATFSVGRDAVRIEGGIEVSIYSPERTITDSFRLMHREGSDVAYEALRRWLRRRGSSPSTLLSIAASFPSTQARMRQALEILL